MPLQLGPIRDVTKRIDLTFDLVEPEQSFYVVYKPYVITPQIEENLQDAIKNEEKGIAIELFQLIVTEWDVRDDRDPNEVLDLADTREIMKQVPTFVLGWITDKILEAQNPNRKKPLNLRTGSSVVGAVGRHQATT